ncbi:hypothetical protein [Actinomyces sp. 2119]|uniref:hypothetical protein n=1 Tax=Actinomyces sp. 2119 TaxID=2321393 RepID=UPI0016012E4D|nr:hypothetical protein [Actinomyces sp. 2119]
MGVNYMVVAMDPTQQMIDADTFLREAQNRWPGCQAVVEDPARLISDATANISPPDAPPFRVTHFPHNRMVSTDAHPQVAAEVAAWVRSLHPDPSLVLWYTDQGFAGHTVLTPGITPTQIDHQWVDHHGPVTGLETSGRVNHDEPVTGAETRQTPPDSEDTYVVQYQLVTDSGKTIMTDDLRPAGTTYTAYEVKYTRGGPGAVYEGKAPPLIQDLAMNDFHDEIRRYGDVIASQGNPVARLVVITSTPGARTYLEMRIQAVLGENGPFEVRYIP